MEQSNWDKFLTNVRNLYKMASVQFVTIVTALWEVFLQIPEEMQQTVIQHLSIIPSWLYPILYWIMHNLLRAKPQVDISPAVAEAKSANPTPKDPS